jgi:hypothetical protein
MGAEPRTRRTAAQVPVAGAGALCVAAALASAAAGCGGPSRPEDCEAMAAGTARDECYLAVLPDVFRQDPTRGGEFAQRIDDPLVRDFLYLTVTREIDPATDRWCNLIQEDALQGRCKLIVSRPHLHREILGDAPGGRAPPPGGGPRGPGGPPPGGPPPSGGGAPPPGGRSPPAEGPPPPGP